MCKCTETCCQYITPSENIIQKTSVRTLSIWRTCLTMFRRAASLTLGCGLKLSSTSSILQPHNLNIYVNWRTWINQLKVNATVNTISEQHVFTLNCTFMAIYIIIAFVCVSDLLKSVKGFCRLKKYCIVSTWVPK